MKKHSFKPLGWNLNENCDVDCGSVHFTDPQSMDYHDGLPKWTARETT